jgi:hypothetical protein
MKGIKCGSITTISFLVVLYPRRIPMNPHSSFHTELPAISQRRKKFNIAASILQLEQLYKKLCTKYGKTNGQFHLFFFYLKKTFYMACI